ncbi:GNAT family N-acetyltransferase [Actinopolymorpha alba]|uniref:GNAT family N-acetyltransferase n=1 Tax=Actinopolymorpha alba TaxID=533267 RepID=UPI00036E5A5D|nr:N-acetyltransferase [Actinopolymorpha alba]
MLIRRELPNDVDAIRAVQFEAFHRPDLPDPERVQEADLVDWLRAGDDWIPELSLVALDGAGEVVGHVVCSRAYVEDRPVLGLGPLGVRPDHQGRGVGHALMHAVLGASDGYGAPAVILLGEPAFYSRFGFEPAGRSGIIAPEPDWGEYFQVRRLTTYDDGLRGRCRYAEEFGKLA